MFAVWKQLKAVNRFWWRTSTRHFVNLSTILHAFWVLQEKSLHAFLLLIINQRRRGKKPRQEQKKEKQTRVKETSKNGFGFEICPWVFMDFQFLHFISCFIKNILKLCGSDSVIFTYLNHAFRQNISKQTVCMLFISTKYCQTARLEVQYYLK